MYKVDLSPQITYKFVTFIHLIKSPSGRSGYLVDTGAACTASVIIRALRQVELVSLHLGVQEEGAVLLAPVEYE